MATEVSLKRRRYLNDDDGDSNDAENVSNTNESFNNNNNNNNAAKKKKDRKEDFFKKPPQLNNDDSDGNGGGEMINRSNDTHDSHVDNEHKKYTNGDAINIPSITSNSTSFELLLLQKHMYMMPLIPSFVLKLKENQKNIYLMNPPSGYLSNSGSDKIRDSFVKTFIQKRRVLVGNDLTRIKAFNVAVKSGIKDNTYKDWLKINYDSKVEPLKENVNEKEIGSGADNEQATGEITVHPKSSVELLGDKDENETKNENKNIVFENIGLIFSSEFVVDIIHEIHQKYKPSSMIHIPRYGATFYTPVSIGDNAERYLQNGLNINQKGFGVQVDCWGSWLITHSFPVNDAAVFTFPVNDDPSTWSSSSSSSDDMQIDKIRSPTTGLLEFFDFSSPLDKSDVLKQQYEKIFTVDGDRESVSVDGLALWIWAGSDRSLSVGAPTKGTGFPYGIDNAKLPNRNEIASDFSSRFSETDGGSWSNIVMLFEPPLILHNGNQLQITSVSDLTEKYHPKYSFAAKVVNTQTGVTIKEQTTKMNQLYHQYNVFDY